MQGSKTTPDIFQAQRGMATRPTLSSEIVRSVFQRARNNDDCIMKPSMLGIKRSSRVIPPLATAFISPANYNTKAGSSVTTDALAVIATCTAKDSESEQPPVKSKRVRLKTERRREQCRVNQARYRQKQLNHAKVLEESVQELRADIPVLELQRNRLLYGGQQDIWNVVEEYCHLFRFGVPMTLPLTSEDEGISARRGFEHLENAEAKRQLAFLRSSMTNDVILGEHNGVESLMEQWELYSSSFQSLYVQLERIERVNDTFVSAMATLNVTVSEMTLRNVFPHLLDRGADGGEGDTKVLIRSRLLGSRLQIPCSLCFEWDTNSCRVVRLETTYNFVTPLLKVLKDTSDVAFVLEHALITRDGTVGLTKLCYAQPVTQSPSFFTSSF
ncbi:bZIP transcription factor 1 [Phytophthora citrophthora]|uniref:BZIP transcription factor 1 n=1 Tax=Phytophthora citrophthora TaxID=4793 RepID=A0AAD9G2L3_9STRA|nr:bZIP transcription factor 1 [Phytophthora citrophthora]